MALFQGKSPAERNKIIAAIVLGVLAVGALFFAFGPNLFSRGTSASTQATPTPKVVDSANKNPDQFRMPTDAERDLGYMIPVVYNPFANPAADPGRNIFAFYEPPPPTPWVPTPLPPTPPPPTPKPPDILIGFIQPQSVYAGSRGFRLEVNGDRFTPDARIYFSQAAMPTTFVSPQRLTTDIPANMISGEGPRQVIIQTPDGKLYSNQVMLMVQAPPKPQVQYVGMIARKHGNNDTAYFIEQNRVNLPGVVPSGARLNDVISGRFRLVSIASAEVIVEDVNLGFRHKLPLFRPPPGTTSAGGGSGFPSSGTGFSPSFPSNSSFPSAGFPVVPRPPRPASNANSNRPVRREEKDEDDDEPDN